MSELVKIAEAISLSESEQQSGFNLDDSCDSGDDSQLRTPNLSHLLRLFSEPFRQLNSRAFLFEDANVALLQSLRKSVARLLNCVASRVLTRTDALPTCKVSLDDLSHFLFTELTPIREPEICAAVFIQLYTLLMTKATCLPSPLPRPHLSGEPECSEDDRTCEQLFVTKSHPHVLKQLNLLLNHGSGVLSPSASASDTTVAFVDAITTGADADNVGVDTSVAGVCVGTAATSSDARTAGTDVGLCISSTYKGSSNAASAGTSGATMMPRTHEALQERLGGILRLYSVLVYNYRHTNIVELCQSLCPALAFVFSLVLQEPESCLPGLLKYAADFVANSSYYHTAVQQLFLADSVHVAGAEKTDMQVIIGACVDAFCSTHDHAQRRRVSSAPTALALLKAYLNCAFNVVDVYDHNVIAHLVKQVAPLCTSACISTESNIASLLQLGQTASALLYKSDVHRDHKLLLPILSKDCFRYLADKGRVALGDTDDQGEDGAGDLCEGDEQQACALWPMSQLNADSDSIAAAVFQTVAVSEAALATWTYMYWCGNVEPGLPASILDRLCIGGLHPETALSHLRRLKGEIDESNILPWILQLLRERLQVAATTGTTSADTAVRALRSEVGVGLRRTLEHWLDARRATITADDDDKASPFQLSGVFDEVMSVLAQYVTNALECDHENHFIAPSVKVGIQQLFFAPGGCRNRVVIAITPGQGPDRDSVSPASAHDAQDLVSQAALGRKFDRPPSESSEGAASSSSMRTELDSLGNVITQSLGIGEQAVSVTPPDPDATSCEVCMLIADETVSSTQLEEQLHEAGFVAPREGYKLWFHGCLSSKAAEILTLGALVSGSTRHDLGRYESFYLFEKWSLARAHALNRRENDKLGLDQTLISPCVLMFEIPTAELQQSEGHMIINSIEEWRTVVHVSHNDFEQIRRKSLKSEGLTEAAVRAEVTLLNLKLARRRTDFKHLVETLQTHLATPSWMFSWMCHHPTDVLNKLIPKHENELPGMSSDDPSSTLVHDRARGFQLPPCQTLNPPHSETWTVQHLPNICDTHTNECTSPVIGQLSLNRCNAELECLFMKGLRAVFFLKRKPAQTLTDHSSDS